MYIEKRTGRLRKQGDLTVDLETAEWGEQPFALFR